MVGAAVGLADGFLGGASGFFVGKWVGTSVGASVGVSVGQTEPPLPPRQTKLLAYVLSVESVHETCVASENLLATLEGASPRVMTLEAPLQSLTPLKSNSSGVASLQPML